MRKLHIVLLLLLFLTLLFIITGPNCLGHGCGGEGKTREEQAEVDVRNLRNALEMYKIDNGFYPSSSQGLIALLIEPIDAPKPLNWHAANSILSPLPKDPWNRDYLYRNPGVNDLVEVYTLGRDGNIGGRKGSGQDIVSEPFKD